MKSKKLLIFLIIVLTWHSFSTAQSGYERNKMTMKIDSLIQYKKIDLITIKMGLEQELTTSDASSIKFDGNFMVIRNQYFNMNRLIYFRVRTVQKKKWMTMYLN